MNTVWLIQQPRGIKRDRGYWEPDLAPAAQFGKIVPILNSDDRPSLLPVPTYHKLKRTLAAGYKDGDFFLWAGGDPAALFIAGAVAQEMGFAEVQFLRWERARNDAGKRDGGFYVPTTIRYRSELNEH